MWCEIFFDFVVRVVITAADGGYVDLGEVLGLCVIAGREKGQMRRGYTGSPPAARTSRPRFLRFVVNCAKGIPFWSLCPNWEILVSAPGVKKGAVFCTH